MRAIAATVLYLWAAVAQAGQADVVAAEIVRTGDAWRVSATVRHADEGWEHYADAWRVLGPDGAVLGLRTLHHPHVAEQPFTRSLGGVVIPEGVEAVEVEARDSVHGWGGARVRIAVPR